MKTSINHPKDIADLVDDFGLQPDPKPEPG
jgi:hypothetical protein